MAIFGHKFVVGKASWNLRIRLTKKNPSQHRNSWSRNVEKPQFHPPVNHWLRLPSTVVHPSRGSEKHHSGSCQPCSFFLRGDWRFFCEKLRSRFGKFCDIHEIHGDIFKALSDYLASKNFFHMFWSLIFRVSLKLHHELHVDIYTFVTTAEMFRFCGSCYPVREFL